MVHPEKQIIGSHSNFWTYSESDGYDLTHPPTPKDTVAKRLTLETTTTPIAIDPSKTALIVVDFQNFFLSPSLGKPKDSKGLKAAENLLEFAVPACRKAQVQIIWLNWGLTQTDIDEMPPATLRCFGGIKPARSPLRDVQNASSTSKGNQNIPGSFHGLGSDIGLVPVEDGETVDAGRLLMRDQWNSALYAPLENARLQSLRCEDCLDDVVIHKNRLSGFWGASTACTEYLETKKIQTLIFAGVNTDQCVGGSLQDAFTKGYDCLLLSDASATTSPGDAQACVEFNAERIFGFVFSCQDLAAGAEKMQCEITGT